jgi:hypothetical protein
LRVVKLDAFGFLPSLKVDVLTDQILG